MGSVEAGVGVVIGVGRGIGGVIVGAGVDPRGFISRT
jgi:hypothetical protein